MIKFKTFSHEYQVVAQLNEWETEGYDLTKYFIRITITMTPVKVSGNQTVFNIFYDATLDEKCGIERVMKEQSDKVDNEDETLKGMVKVFCTPKGYTDKLATEVSIRGTKIYPPKGMLIGKVTPKDNSFFVEFVGNDEELTDTDKKAIGFRFEVKQDYADRPPEYTMVEVPMDEALYRNIPKVSDFPYDNRVKFLDYAETYLKAKGLIPIDNVSLTRYEIIHDERNLTSTASIEDENIDTFIEYLTTQHKYMHSEKCKRRCEKLIKQMKMVKIISEIMELKGDEEITDTDKKDENAVKDSCIKPSGTVEIGYAGAWDFDDFTRELTRIETNYLGKTGEMDYCTFLAVLSHIRNVYEKLHKGEGM